MSNRCSQLLGLIIYLIAGTAFSDNDWLVMPGQANQNPFVRIHGLSGYSGSRVLSYTDHSVRIDLGFTNEYHIQSKHSEQATLDFEQARIVIDYSYGLMKGVSAGVNLPFLSNSGGFMDGLIEDWHDVFNLPQGGRDNAPSDRLLISYENPDTSILVDQDSTGIGDLSFYLDKQLLDHSSYQLKARSKLKLPTGNEDQLFGSGGYGLGLSVNASAILALGWSTYGALGVELLETANVLPDQQKNIVATANIGVTWLVNEDFGFSAGLDFNSSVYDQTALDAISGEAGILNLAAGYRFSDDSTLLLGIVEDVVNKDASPDFGINLSFTHSF